MRGPTGVGLFSARRLRVTTKEAVLVIKGSLTSDACSMNARAAGMAPSLWIYHAV